MSLGWGLFLWTHLSFTSSFPPTRRCHSKGMETPKRVVNVWNLLRFSHGGSTVGASPRFHFGGRRKQKQLVIFLVCLSVYLYLWVTYILSADSVLHVHAGGAERKILQVWMVLEGCSISPGGTQ